MARWAFGAASAAVRWRGHRIKKDTYNGSGTLVFETYYVRDVSGTVLGIYSKLPGGMAQVSEQAIYGNGRIGIYHRADDSSSYELTDHLGNVRATFTKSGNNAQLEGTIDSGIIHYSLGHCCP